MDLHIFKSSHSKVTEYIFFLSANGTFSRINHMLGHKRSLRFRKIKSCQIFSEHSDMKLEINCKKKARKSTTMWRLNNMLPNSYWVIEKIKEVKTIHGDKLK